MRLIPVPLPLAALERCAIEASSLPTRTTTRPSPMRCKRRDIPDRVLARTIPDVEGVYDRSDYLPDKCDALGQLVTLADQILKCIEW